MEAWNWNPCFFSFFFVSMLTLLFLNFVLTAKILPVVKNQHLLLCTLLICNAAAMEVSILSLIIYGIRFTSKNM